MKNFLMPLRRKDLIAAAAVETLVAVIFLVCGMFWQCAIFALMASMGWYVVLKKPQGVGKDAEG